MNSHSGVLHLTLGDHACDNLRAAITRNEPSSDAYCIRDDLGHGPLDDGVARIAYMRQCYRGFDDWSHAETDAFAGWYVLADTLHREPRDLVVWAPPNVSESVLLAMACWWLHAVPVRILAVEPTDGRHTGARSSAELTALVEQACELDSTRRAVLVAEFERLRSDGGLRRLWQQGRVVTVAPSACDGLLLSQCSHEWQVAARVVGNAMGQADRRDGLSDVFLSSRLQVLNAEGRVEADRDAGRLREYAVRLPGAA